MPADVHLEILSHATCDLASMEHEIQHALEDAESAVQNEELTTILDRCRIQSQTRSARLHNLKAAADAPIEIGKVFDLPTWPAPKSIRMGLSSEAADLVTVLHVCRRLAAMRQCYTDTVALAHAWDVEHLCGPLARLEGQTSLSLDHLTDARGEFSRKWSPSPTALNEGGVSTHG